MRLAHALILSVLVLTATVGNAQAMGQKTSDIQVCADIEYTVYEEIHSDEYGTIKIPVKMYDTICYGENPLLPPRQTVSAESIQLDK